MIMKNTSLRSAFTAAVITLVAGTGAQALPAAGNYAATTAGPEAPYTQHSANHAIWLPGQVATTIGGGSDWVFTPLNGDYTITNGASKTMHLEGNIASTSQPGNFFFVSMDFRHYSEFPTSIFHGGAPSAKLELAGSAYSSNGGPVDPSTWDFYVMLGTSYMTGLSGDVAGLHLNLTQREMNGKLGPVTQIGFGASGKNTNFGMSTWFNYSGDLSGHGDVNIDLNGGGGGSSVAEPTAVALFGMGLIGLGLAARRRKQR